MLRYKLVTFDITGTILKFKHPPGVHYANVGAKFGINVDPHALSTSFKKQWKHLNNSKPNFGLNHHGWEQWWSEAVTGTFIDAGVTNNDPQVLTNIAKLLIDIYTTPKCWQHCDGAIPLLSKLKSNNIPIGVVSNFDARLEIILKNMKIRDYFDFVVTSYDAGYTKPDPRIFDTALTKIDMSIEPKDILHVGDTKDLDYEGACRVGWNSWLVSSSPGELKTSSGTLEQLHNHLFKS